MGRVPEGSETATIAVMGATGSGKSSFINLVSGSSLRTSDSLHSCTEEVAVTEPFVVDSRKVVLVDTPGFDDTNKSDSDILKLIADFLTSSYKDGHTLTGLIFIHRISDHRMGGISLKNFRTFRKLCGEQTLRNVVIVTNMWSGVDPHLGEERERELATNDTFFKPALDKGTKMFRHTDSLESALSIIRYILGNRPVVLQIQKELVDEKKDISQTAAVDELERQLQAAKEAQRIETERLKRELEEAERAREEEARRQREAEARHRQEELDRIEAERKRAEEQRTREQREWEERMRVEEQERKAAIERQQRELEAKIAEERRQREETERRRREAQARYERELAEMREREREAARRREAEAEAERQRQWEYEDRMARERARIEEERRIQRENVERLERELE
ncbi:P-loop containing nucleoside triphosphate hydrolase protein [Ephemerocybe angulata]|uniref:P-loop containing nucleoside triphosphate hydrolase protein n=1 Tax=Ephemerocybe angulata TaxID=980116 RepID=A0A8H6HWP5_9AGAR|nr:P-loop containing nucleoside triphosphate hydrolase protein [Tulosesus angulatus]